MGQYDQRRMLQPNCSHSSTSDSEDRLRSVANAHCEDARAASPRKRRSITNGREHFVTVVSNTKVLGGVNLCRGSVSATIIMCRSDSRIPAASFGTAEEDALRRDFTLNALFFNVNEAKLEDMTGRYDRRHTSLTRKGIGGCSG